MSKGRYRLHTSSWPAITSPSTPSITHEGNQSISQSGTHPSHPWQRELRKKLKAGSMARLVRCPCPAAPGRQFNERWVLLWLSAPPGYVCQWVLADGTFCCCSCSLGSVDVHARAALPWKVQAGRGGGWLSWAVRPCLSRKNG